MSKLKPVFKNKKISKPTKALPKSLNKLTKKSVNGHSQIAVRKTQNTAKLKIWTCFSAFSKA